MARLPEHLRTADLPIHRLLNCVALFSTLVLHCCVTLSVALLCYTVSCTVVLHYCIVVLHCVLHCCVTLCVAASCCPQSGRLLLFRVRQSEPKPIRSSESSPHSNLVDCVFLTIPNPPPFNHQRETRFSAK